MSDETKIAEFEKRIENLETKLPAQDRWFKPQFVSARATCRHFRTKVTG